MVPGARPGLLLPDLDGRNNAVARRLRHYVPSADRLRSADHQVAPSGVIDPLRTSPETPPGLLAYVSCMLELPPQVGCWSAYRQARQLLYPSGGGVPLGTGASGS